jgi:pimeloyl-ACP methyl ester carboxylesterase
MKSTSTFLITLIVLLNSCQETTKNEMEIKNQDVSIHYSTCGDADTTLLFVHGWCINESYWETQVKHFCNNYKIVTMDLPGFGQSGKNRTEWTVENYAADVNAVVNQLGLKNVILIGHSMGGNIVMEAALNNDKVIGLIGVDNLKEVGKIPTDTTKAEIEGFLQMLNQNYSGVIKMFTGQYLFAPESDPAIRKRVETDFLNADSTIAINSIGHYMRFEEKQAAKLTQLNRKFYFINSAYTPTDKAGLEATGVDFKVYDIHGTGHYPMVEKADSFNILLEQAMENF